MGTFYFKSSSLEELCSKVWGCESSLKALSEEIKRISDSLDTQRGMGIEEIRQQIRALSTQTLNLSGSMGDTAYFLKKVDTYVQEAEQKSIKDLEGENTSNSEQPQQQNAIQSLINWIIEENKNGNPFLDLSYYNKIIGEVNGWDLLAIGLTQNELIGKGLIANVSGGLTVRLIEESIAATLSQYAAVPMEFDEGAFLELAKSLQDMGMEWTEEWADFLLSQDEFKDLEWCKTFKEYAGMLDIADKAFDFSRFTAEQMAKYLVDYEQSLAVLNNLKSNTPAGTQTAQAIDNLINKYNDIWFSVVEDSASEGINYGVDILKGAAGGGALVATLDAVYKVTGLNDYAENLLKAEALQIQHSDIYNGFSELKMRIARGEAGIESRASDAEYQKFSEMFDYLKENKIQEYQLLKELTNDRSLQTKLDQEIENMKNYEIGQLYAQ